MRLVAENGSQAAVEQLQSIVEVGRMLLDLGKADSLAWEETVSPAVARKRRRAGFDAFATVAELIAAREATKAEAFWHSHRKWVMDSGRNVKISMNRVIDLLD
jgi:hypothetical protein